MRVVRSTGGAFQESRASDTSLLFLVTMELAEPDHLCLKPDEKPDRKDANRLTPNSRIWKSHGNENFQLAPCAFRRADYRTTPSTIELG